MPNGNQGLIKASEAIKLDHRGLVYSHRGARRGHGTGYIQEVKTRKKWYS